MIYLDNAATTQVSEKVLEEMKPFIKKKFGNPSSFYKIGAESKLAVDKARKRVADAIDTVPERIFFTSGGSESDNWAIRSALESGKKHIIVSSFEHHAILNLCKYLEKHGYKVTYLPVSKDGFVKPSDVSDNITSDTAIVSVMMANNEIGTIQNIDEIAKICKKHDVLFHTDAVQATGHIYYSADNLNVDMLSISGHKFHGPKGIGILYSRVPMTPLIFGGQQESHLRGGTENISGIVGIGKAIELAAENLGKNQTYVKNLRSIMVERLSKLEGFHINGNMEYRLPGNLNVRFDNIESEALIEYLNLHNICVSAGSACNTADKEPSHVLKAIGLTNDQIHSSVRITIDAVNTEKEIVKACDTIEKGVKKLRKINL